MPTAAHAARPPASARFRRTLLAAVAAALLVPAGLAHAAGSGDAGPDVAKLLPADLHGALRDALPPAAQSKATLVVATDATAGKPYALGHYQIPASRASPWTWRKRSVTCSA